MILFTPLLLLALSGCFSEVVDHFNETCPKFFVNPGGILSPPTVFKGEHYKQICQVREKTPNVPRKYEYATLYDTKNKIPVYSAYTFVGLKHCKRNNAWYIEPQLEDQTGSNEMEPENKIQYENQAVNADYIYSGYDRGQLAPVYHAQSQRCADATFTLTNAAPENVNFNRQIWWNTEQEVAEALGKCRGNVRHIVTGVVPGTNFINNRVNVPSHFWTAYCCLDNNLQVIASHGFLGANVKLPVRDMPARELDENLTTLYGQGPFHVFGGKCDKSSTTRRLMESGGLSRMLCLDDETFPTLSEKRRCMALLRKERKGC